MMKIDYNRNIWSASAFVFRLLLHFILFRFTSDLDRNIDKKMIEKSQKTTFMNQVQLEIGKKFQIQCFKLPQTNYHE